MWQNLHMKIRISEMREAWHHTKKHNITMQTLLLASHEDPPAVVLQKIQVFLDIIRCCMWFNHTILNSHCAFTFRIKQYENTAWPRWRRKHDCLIHQNHWHIDIISATDSGKGQYKSQGDGGLGPEHVVHTLIFSQYAVPPWPQSPKKIVSPWTEPAHSSPGHYAMSQQTWAFNI